jgi:hypothetical protein
VSYPQEPDVDLDEVLMSELGEHDAGFPVVADALVEWAMGHPRFHMSWTVGREREHFVGTFLDLLAAKGYRVTPIPSPDLNRLLPPPEE